MAADQLLGVLSLFGFSESETVAPALRAACEDEEARQIVQWLADNLKSEHLEAVQDRSQQEYQLPQELQHVAKEFSLSLAPNEVTQPSTSISAEVMQSRTRTAKLLADAAADLEARENRAVELEDREKQRLAARVSDLKQQVDKQTEQLTDVLGALNDSVKQLTSALCGREAVLLCLQQLEDFRELDQRFMHALHGFYLAQFNTMPREASLEQEGLSIEAGGGAVRLLSSEDKHAVTSRAIELERMRLAYGNSLEGSVRMLALQAKHEKTLQALQGGLTRPELSSQDVAMLKAEADKQQVYLDRVLERKQQLLDVELPQLCKSLASMHCLDAVKADYDIELQRNKYYGTKKELVLDMLVDRTARIAALVAAAKDEAAMIVGTRNSLQVLCEELEALSSAMQMRLAKCKAVSELSQPGPPSPSSISKAPSVAEMEERQALVDEQLSSVLEEAIPRLQSTSGKIHALAFASGAIKDPVLTPQEFTQAKANLEKIHQSLLEANDAVYKQQEAYNNIMRLQRGQVGLERSVFPTFFTKPEKLVKEARILEYGPEQVKTSARKSRVVR